MQQLTAMDNMFLRMENKRVPTHVSSLLMLDPRTSGKDWGIDDVRQLIQNRIHLVPPMRRRLAYVPGNIDHPYWIEDADFDINFHLRHRALPRPGNNKQLEDLICHLFMRTLDRTRPLWEIYLIEGLENGGMALFTKMHHACIDGVSGLEIMSTLLDLSPKIRSVAPAAEWHGEPEPASGELLKRALKNYLAMPSKFINLLPQAVSSARSMTKMAYSGVSRDEMPNSVFDAPRSLFNKPASTNRRFAFESIPLADIKSLKDAFECSLNDMVLALCAGALRRYCIENKTLPKKALLTMVPISVKNETTKGQAGNHVSAMICSLGTHLADPVERLQAVIKSSNQGKATHKMVGATAMMDWSQFASPALLGLADSLIYRMGVGNIKVPMFNVAISNVPGVRVPLYWAGAKVLSNYPMSVTTDNMGINITLVSYMDNVDFGITVDSSIVPDPWVILQYIKDSLVEYRQIAEQTSTALPSGEHEKALTSKPNRKTKRNK